MTSNGPTDVTNANVDGETDETAGGDADETAADDADETAADDADAATVTVETGAETVTLSVPRGTTLRDALLDAECSPYADATERFNCGGRGLCATCGVRVLDGETPPTHWHDRLAARFGYPRLSCQYTVEDDVTVRLLPERVWGSCRE